MSPFTLHPARSSQRSAAVMLPFTVPSTMTDRVWMSPLILACLPTVSRPWESIRPSTSQSRVSSFWNLTVPLMETPLERVPPCRLNSGVPFDAGSVLTGGAGGGGADIGMAGSTFRLLENICIDWVSFGREHETVMQKGQPILPSRRL